MRRTVRCVPIPHVGDCISGSGRGHMIERSRRKRRDRFCHARPSRGNLAPPSLTRSERSQRQQALLKRILVAPFHSPDRMRAMFAAPSWLNTRPFANIRQFVYEYVFAMHFRRECTASQRMCRGRCISPPLVTTFAHEENATAAAYCVDWLQYIADARELHGYSFAKNCVAFLNCRPRF